MNEKIELIAKLDDQQRRAVTAADTETLDRIFSDSLIFFHMSGVRDVKESFLTAIGTRTQVPELELVDREIIVFGDAAVVTTEERGRALLIEQGTTLALHIRAMAVWAREGDEWRLTRYQVTPMGQLPLMG